MTEVHRSSAIIRIPTLEAEEAKVAGAWLRTRLAEEVRRGAGPRVLCRALEDYLPEECLN